MDFRGCLSRQFWFNSTEIQSGKDNINMENISLKFDNLF